ncbi:hypothetical protein CC86DRAFT_361270 [Ophiobolus disseminans]|uniref:Uncharacterized protein n=1 Tax=Ophiobolus disseminans TaxID=1469910 RepID=A0A6A6ZGP3_9PLEO|nr:hypothetical protein CC86DRAFT_361270 [Ophiobolus disseminans]
MSGKKRTRDGQVKPSDTTQQLVEPTPPCAQRPLPSSTTTESQTTNQTEVAVEEPSELNNDVSNPAKPAQQATPKPKPESQPKTNSERQKLPKLPNNTTISRRPLLHPALPTPFSSSASPKVLYITAKSPFIPTLKRIRKLLTEIEKRAKQSAGAMSRGSRKKGALEANGRLKSADVEKGLVDEVTRQKGVQNSVSAGEKVCLKATGRAIPRALELGVQFQEDGDCVVKVEMGSVKAIDDIEVHDKEGIEEGAVDDAEEEDIPETRIRTIGSVTVSIGLK